MTSSDVPIFSGVTFLGPEKDTRQTGVVVGEYFRDDASGFFVEVTEGPDAGRSLAVPFNQVVTFNVEITRTLPAPIREIPITVTVTGKAEGGA